MRGRRYRRSSGYLEYMQSAEELQQRRSITCPAPPVKDQTVRASLLATLVTRSKQRAEDISRTSVLASLVGTLCSPGRYTIDSERTNRTKQITTNKKQKTKNKNSMNKSKYVPYKTKRSQSRVFTCSSRLASFSCRSCNIRSSPSTRRAASAFAVASCRVNSTRLHPLLSVFFLLHTSPRFSGVVLAYWLSLHICSSIIFL